jgi:5-formyltetrahydrofolate cyclo-ligase
MPNTDEIREEKSRIRRLALQFRDAQSVTDRAQFSEIIENSALAILREIPAQRVHTYLSYRSEVATIELVRSLLSDNVAVFAPVMISSNDGDMLRHSQIFSMESFRPGLHGIPEPEGPDLTKVANLGAVLIPLVAFDRSGTRLGYGRGFYDRFLESLPEGTMRIGLAFSFQEFSHIPAESHDVPLDRIVTERMIIECQK